MPISGLTKPSIHKFMTRFRPCIDLHQGKVKQIVGGTLTDGEDSPTTNFTSDRDAAWYAQRYY